MRVKKKISSAGKLESPEEVKQRLVRVARKLPTTFINDSMGDLAERCNKLYATTGGLFEEVGRKKRRRPL